MTHCASMQHNPAGEADFGVAVIEESRYLRLRLRNRLTRANCFFEKVVGSLASYSTSR